jgi:hypothetical protein
MVSTGSPATWREASAVSARSASRQSTTVPDGRSKLAAYAVGERGEIGADARLGRSGTGEVGTNPGALMADEVGERELRRLGFGRAVGDDGALEPMAQTATLERCSARAIEDDVERGLLQVVIAGHEAIGTVIGELSRAARETAVPLAASWDDVMSYPAGRRGVVPPVAPRTHMFG